MIMDISIRPMKKEEESFCYTQEQKLMEESGCIGHLRADMDTNGKGFFSSWDDHCADKKTQAFKTEFDEFINALRCDEQYGELLKDRSSLASYCYDNAEKRLDDDRSYGFRADAGEYSYMLRLNPNKGDYNLYCYAYERQALDSQLRQLQDKAEIEGAPLYVHPAEHAREHDELPQYRASNKANTACKKALEDAINGNYRNNCLDSAMAFKQVSDVFGRDRVVYVLANSVRQKSWDGRISDKNKAWAQTIPVHENKDSWGTDRNCYFVVDQAHTGLLDLLVTHVRKELEKEKEQPQKKPSVLGKLQKFEAPSAAEPMKGAVKKSKEAEL
jgi:hypothetical protein